MARTAVSGAVTALRPRRAGVRYHLAGPDDDATVRSLLRGQSFGGQVRVALTREPDAALAAAIEGDPHHTILAREGEEGRVIGIGSRAVRTVWLDGRPVRLGYLGLLRRNVADRRAVRHLAAGYRAMERTRRTDEQPFDLTAVVADNLAARRLLEGGRHGLPTYRSVGEWVSWVMTTRRGDRANVRRGDATLLPAIVDCLRRNLRRHAFAPVWTLEDLESEERTRGLSPGDFLVELQGDRVVACLALWDQRSFKQTVVTGYGTPLAGRFRPLVNLALAATGRPRLPAAGSELRLAFLSHLAADEHRSNALLRLIAAARTEAAGRGLDYLTLGLARGNALLDPVRNAFPGRAYTSILYLVHPADNTVSLPRLDGIVPHVEVATL